MISRHGIQLLKQTDLPASNVSRDRASAVRYEALAITGRPEEGQNIRMATRLEAGA
jgi:hypothetical protein